MKALEFLSNLMPKKAAPTTVNCPECPEFVCPVCPVCPQTFEMLFYGLLSFVVFYTVASVIFKLKKKLMKAKS